MYTDHEEPENKRIAVFGSDQAKEILPYDQPAYTRTIQTREVTFTCEECGKLVIQQRYPSPIPLYCSDGCKDEARRRTIRDSVRRYRERKKQQE